MTIQNWIEQRWHGNPSKGATRLLPLLVVLSMIGAAPLHAQVLSPNGIPTAPYISTQVQHDIDEDLAHHIGSVVADPGPKAKLSSSLSPAAVHAAMRRVGDWELSTFQPYFNRDWTWSVLYVGYLAAARELHDTRYQDAMLAVAEKYHWEFGKDVWRTGSWPDTDEQIISSTYMGLYSLQPAPEKIEPTRKAFDALIAAGPDRPAPPGQAPITWWFCDALFTSPPAWSRMSAITHNLKYLDYANRNWWATSNALYDTHYHLFFRDKTFIGRTDRAGKPIFWSRGSGWVVGGLVRTLRFMPKNYPDRARYENHLREMAAELASLQDPKNGLWHADLLDPTDYPQPEVSGSALITFGLAWGVNNGVLDRATYTPVIAKAWRGMVDQIYADGRLGNIQQTDGQPNRYLPSSSFNYGVGGFLLAGSEVAHLEAHPGHPSVRDSGLGRLSLSAVLLLLGSGEI
jgi:rhamnogalacturonyl hydrolase YesR